MLQVINRTQVMAARDYALGVFYGALLRVQDNVQRVNLRSRRGEGNTIWTILVIGLIAVVATVALFPIGQRMISMGTEAAGKLQSPPW